MALLSGQDTDRTRPDGQVVDSNPGLSSYLATTAPKLAFSLQQREPKSAKNKITLLKARKFDFPKAGLSQNLISKSAKNELSKGSIFEFT